MARTVPDETYGLVAGGRAGVQTYFKLVLEAFNGVCRGMGALKTTQVTPGSWANCPIEAKIPNLTHFFPPEPAFRSRVHEPRGDTWELDMGRGLLLWLIGIPLPIILVVWLLGGLS